MEFYLVKSNLRRDGKKIKEGETLKLSAEDAAPLLASKTIDPQKEAVTPDEAVPGKKKKGNT